MGQESAVGRGATRGVRDVAYFECDPFEPADHSSSVIRDHC